MISNFVQIPTSLLQDWLLPLLEVVDFVRLDTAVLNHNERLVFLKQIQGVRLMKLSFPIDSRAAQWLIDRNIRVSVMHVSDTATDLTMVKQLTASVDTLVRLDNCNMLTEEAVVDFIQECKKVKHLSFQKCNRANIIVESIPHSCTALEAIDLSDNAAIDLNNLVVLTSGCKLLTELSMNICFWVNDACVEAIAANCPQLQKLSLNTCNQCGDKTLQVVAQYCHNLRNLSLRALDFLTDDGVGALAVNCAELRTLLYCGSSNITSAGIITLAQGCTKLEEIGYLKCDEHIDLAVAALVQHCPALNTLRCFSPHFTDKSLHHLQNCPLLHTLELIDAIITSPVLMTVIDCCVFLRCLNFSGCEIWSTVPASKGAIEDAHRPYIIELNLESCIGLTEAALLVVLTHCGKLQSIDLSYIFVSDANISTLVENCPDLRSIKTRHCDLLTDAAASAIAQHCPYLNNLDMSFCTKITDAGIVEILQKCRQLRELFLNRCIGLTRKVLDAAVQYGARLRKLHLRGCTNIGTDAATAFRSAKPNCILL